MKFFPQKKVRLTANISQEEFNAKLKEIINNDSYGIRLIGQNEKNTFHITRHVVQALFNLWYNGQYTFKNNTLTLDIDINYEADSKALYFILSAVILIFVYFIGFWVLTIFLILPYAYIASFISEDSKIVLKCFTEELNASVEEIESTNIFTPLINNFSKKTN